MVNWDRENIRRGTEEILNKLERQTHEDFALENGHFYTFTHNFGVVAKQGGETIELLIQTGDEKTHIPFYTFHSDVGPVEIELFDGVSFDSQGSELDSFANLNRNYADSPVATITHSPTNSSVTGAKKLEDSWFGSSKQGGVTRVDYVAWILEPNTNYLLRGYNRSSGSDSTYFNFIGYGHKKVL